MFLKILQKSQKNVFARVPFLRLETWNYEKQPLEMTDTDVSEIHSKKPVLESLFDKVSVLRAWNFIKEDSNTGAVLWNLQTF